MTCSRPGCNRHVSVYKECWEHRPVVPGEFRRPTGEVFDLVNGEWIGPVVEARICSHGFDQWTDCPGCVAAADWDRGMFGAIS